MIELLDSLLCHFFSVWRATSLRWRAIHCNPDSEWSRRLGERGGGSGGCLSVCCSLCLSHKNAQTQLSYVILYVTVRDELVNGIQSWTFETPNLLVDIWNSVTHMPKVPQQEQFYLLGSSSCRNKRDLLPGFPFLAILCDRWILTWLKAVLVNKVI